MEPEKENKTTLELNKTDDNVCFSQVTAVVTEWMRDFLFVCLCRSFKEENLDEFNKTMSTLQTISQSLPQNEKILICSFLARVMHGKLFDVSFEDDKKVMPLMSAANIWSDLKKTVEDESLVKNMTILLFVQSVAVCLETGQKSSASFVIQWFEEHFEFLQTLRVKLGTVVAQEDNYHPFLMSFSYSRLLETTQTYLEAYLTKNPSDYLLKAATKAVQSSGNTLGDAVPKNSSLAQTAKESTVKDKENEENTLCMRSKRRLLSTTNCNVWTPEPCKKSYVCLKRISRNELPVHNETAMICTKKERRRRTKWTYQLDENLIEGVRRHGLGKWSRILLDFDFKGRTGTMLKDRWRVLQKSQKM